MEASEVEKIVEAAMIHAKKEGLGGLARIRVKPIVHEAIALAVEAQKKKDAKIAREFFDPSDPEMAPWGEHLAEAIEQAK